MLKKKIKKILIMNVLYRPNIGGVENSIHELSNALCEQGIEVDILCSDRNNTNSTILKEYENLGKYSIYRYHYASGFFSYIKNFFNARKKMTGLIKEKNYDYIISRNSFNILVASTFGMRNIPYIIPEVYKFASTKQNLNRMGMIKSKVKNMTQFAAFILADNYVFSETMKKQVYESSWKLCTPKLIDPGVNLKRFIIPTIEHKNTLRERYNIPNHKKVFLALGRFSTVKQFQYAIESMVNFNDDHLLVVVGVGPELSNYNNIISNNNLFDKVKIFGSTNVPEDFYQLSDIFLMTSNYEPFGQTILEAIASGLKLVAFDDISGVDTNTTKIVNYTNGIYWASEQSVTCLSEAMIKASIDTLSKEDIEMNRNYIISKFSWDKMLLTLSIGS